MSTELNLNTKSKVAELVDTLVAYLPEILGIDETIPGSIVTDLDPFGVGVGVYPRFIEVALRNQYRQYVRYLSNAGLIVNDTCIVQHIRDGNIYVVMGTGGAASGGTKTFGVEATGGSNGTCLTYCNLWGIQLAQGAERYAYGMFVVPDNYDSDLKVKAIAISAVTGDAYIQNDAVYGACGEAYNTHQNNAGTAAVTITQYLYNCVQEITLANASVGDIVLLQFIRYGDDENDTLAGSLYIPGWTVSYTST